MLCYLNLATKFKWNIIFLIKESSHFGSLIEFIDISFWQESISKCFKNLDVIKIQNEFRKVISNTKAMQINFLHKQSVESMSFFSIK